MKRGVWGRAHGAGPEPDRRLVHGAGRARPRVVLFVEANGGDWHARRLKTAMEARGASVVTTTLAACAFDTRTPSGLDIPGFDGALPDGAFVRSVSTGTLEQITLRLGVLHALVASGVRVWNNPRAIERCVDKSAATFLFQLAGLPTPQTRAAESAAHGAAPFSFDEEARPLVVKPLFGSQGNGVRRIGAGEPLPPPEELGNVYYMQEYLRSPDDAAFEDWRVFVSGGAILSAMTRKGKTWITNVHQGAEPEFLDPGDEMRRLALGAAQAAGADYAGVDLIRGRDGRLLVLEINSNPAWKGLQSVTGTDIAERLAGDFLAAMDRGGVT